jgi:hypothetical protein
MMVIKNPVIWRKLSERSRWLAPRPLDCMLAVAGGQPGGAQHANGKLTWRDRQRVSGKKDRL